MSERLRDATAEIHAHAEENLFIKKLLAGELSLTEYQVYLAYLLPIYQSLEQYLEQNKRQAATAPLYLPELFRTKKLLVDLNALSLITHQNNIKTPYYLITSAEEAIAAFYVRYFGDVSGGQIIKKSLLKHYDPSLLKTNFYQFDFMTVKGKKIINDLRDRLNQLQLNEEQELLIVTFSLKVFNYTIKGMNKALEI